MLTFSGLADAAPSFYQTGSTLVMSNANVRLEYNLNAGTTDFYWQNSKKISRFYSSAKLGTGTITGTNYSAWSYTAIGSNQMLVSATGNGLPTMKQYFTLDQSNSFLVRVDLAGTNLSANWMAPIIVNANGAVDIGITNDNRALVVPFDNDAFVRYNAMPMNSSSSGFEVGAFYDNTSRNGLVVGSVTHSVWKTGISFVGANNKLSALNAFGGATSPSDVMPHGSVVGNTISSPTIFVGFGTDWRITMENYAIENTQFAPKLVYTNGIPFGWNSWGVIQVNISYAKAIAVSDYFHTNLQVRGFANDGTVYINLDSYWNNLTTFQLQSFVNHCHAYGQKAGIYWGPFIWFGAASSATNTFLEGTTNAYRYSDVLLRDGNGNFQSVDGGLAVDPTHPGTKIWNAYWVNLFTNWGFDYVKMDFLSHGALEGVHYDTNITTGIGAYNEGMSNVLKQINGRMFISQSIAPLFPYQYGNSRRIACDAQQSLIANTAYTMNSVSYGWWLDNLYQYNDPDVMVFGNGASTNEAQSRLISGAVTGIMLNGDDLTTTNGKSAASSFLTNQLINSVARVGQTFTPVEGNTGTSAVNVFSRQEGATWCIAVFNYTSSTLNYTVNFSRVGLQPGSYVMTNLWDGTTSAVSGSFSVSLNGKQSKLFRLASLSATSSPPANLRWSANGNSGTWDTGSSANWFNLTNSQPTVFHSGDSVLFDDKPGVPLNITISGLVTPSTMTVNSITNNFILNPYLPGNNTISGPVSLIKKGTSTLTLATAGQFTGPVDVEAGEILAEGYSFQSVPSITITNNAMVDLRGGNYNNANQYIYMSGSGINGQGALFNSLYTPGFIFNIVLTGDAKMGCIGGTSGFGLSGGSISGPHVLTLDWQNVNGSGEWDGPINIGAEVVGITLTNGTLGMKYLTTACQNPNTVFTAGTNTTFAWYNGTGGFNGSIHMLSNSVARLWSVGTVYNGSTITLDGPMDWSSWGDPGDITFDSAVVLNGIVHIIIGEHNMVYTNVISGPGGLFLDFWNHAMVLSASNTYAGPTIINGPQMVLTGNGSISHSSLIFFGGSNPTTTHLDATGRSDQTLTLASGQMLGGIGGVNGSLVVSNGAVISPAGTNTSGSNPTGTLAVANSVTLNGTTVIKLTGSGKNDMVQAGANITYGGTLNLVNISGSPLAVGNSFQVFSAATYTGSFASITPATPGAGLAWDTTQLNTGVIKVAVGASQPVIGSTTVLGGNLIFSGTGGTANASYSVLTTTNLVTPLANWTLLSTGSFDGSGAFSVTNTISPGSPQQFYRLAQP